MSKLRDALREHRIYNSVELAKAYKAATGEAPAFITFSKGGTWDFSGHRVLRSGYLTDPNSGFPLDRNKRFHGRTASGPSLDEARAWADARYGEAEWVKLPGFTGCLFPKAMADWAKDLSKTAPTRS
ncbi:hypothetical protein [Curtobacterium sp. MCBD17_040]|uniref:hypothetical protein n=1 Tax=Curtobacterium sp. MCBD17_040 TaxID=2175674 RepID=UPI000DA9821F|nr:hypothetical protein [Curtobacterium sp. MCBD17_040]WIB65862.1 hypothetical protein DEI94_17255 [Curtobacterium sp. MCBD17_040]